MDDHKTLSLMAEATGMFLQNLVRILQKQGALSWEDVDDVDMIIPYFVKHQPLFLANYCNFLSLRASFTDTDANVAAIKKEITDMLESAKFYLEVIVSFDDLKQGLAKRLEKLS